MSSHSDIYAVLAQNNYFINEISVILDKHRSKYDSTFIIMIRNTRNLAYDIPKSCWGLLNYSHTENEHTY